MSTCLVTGAAGFIGSHLCEALLDQGHEVRGLDAFIPYYPRPLKEMNLAEVRARDAFTFYEMDLRGDDLSEPVAGCDVVFHLAAMPGLPQSWSNFSLYAGCNIEGTQRLLEAARVANIPHFIYGSTSSVYGREATGPESQPLRPYSPYGLTKLAGEHLCRAYEANFGLPVTVLRFFSVYGPRQRPDMAYRILIDALLNGESFPMFGDGTQSRSNTYVTDCVQGALLAFEKSGVSKGDTFNLGGGEVVTLSDVITLLEEITGKQAVIERHPARPGDQKHTRADIGHMRTSLGYQPTTRVIDGLKAQVKWQTEISR